MTALTLKPGVQLASAVSSTRVIVIRAPESGTAVISLGGHPLVPADGAPAVSGGEGLSGQTLIGKRYVDAGATVELLCTASGPGELEFEGTPMTIKAARALPASD